jgi:hypothetical protein
MSHTKEVSKRKRLTKTMPVLGVAGVAGMSLSLAGGASAATTGPATDNPSKNTGPNHEIFLGEEEMADVSLGTFYVIDKENLDQQQLGIQVARACGGCGGRGCGGRGCGCRGCGGRGCGCRGCGCGGCGGCGCGCCLSWGACRWC